MTRVSLLPCRFSSLPIPESPTFPPQPVRRLCGISPMSGGWSQIVRVSHQATDAPDPGRISPRVQAETTMIAAASWQGSVGTKSETGNQLDGRHDGSADGEYPPHQAGFQLCQGGVQFGARNRLTGLRRFTASCGDHFGLAPGPCRQLPTHGQWRLYRRQCSYQKNSSRCRQCKSGCQVPGLVNTANNSFARRIASAAF